MRAMKKILALTVAATMLVGSGITTLAADPVTGAGSSEGHVDKDVMDFVLPTTDATTFKFSMDPERLIAASIASGKAKEEYADASFPENNDTGVYFLTDTKKYENTSKTVQAINKGAGDATLTVKTKYVAGSNPIAMATAALTGSETDATLYLAANIGGKAQILGSEDATITVVMPGNKSNYEVVYNAEAQTPGYEFVKKTTGLTPWKAVNINLTGAVTDGIAVAANTSAPSVQFTWEYAAKGENDASTEGVSVVDYAAAPAAPANAAPSIAVTSYDMTADTPIVVSVDLGSGDDAATTVASAVYTATSFNLIGNSRYGTYDGDSKQLTITADAVNYILSKGDTATINVTFDDDEENPTVVALTLTKAQ